MRLSALAVFLVVALGSTSAQTTPPAESATAMPDGAGKPIVQRACASCHAITTVTSKRANRKEWDQVVNQMVSRGAELSDDEIDTVIEYLSKNYGPLDQNPASSPDAAATPAPADSGADTGSAGLAVAPAATPVNVNTANAHDLETSLKLSTAEAEAIVKYRTEHGNFKTWKDVAAVPGISSAKIEGMQKRITF